MTNFHVGQKVVCVDDSPYRHLRVSTGLVENAIYTIREIDHTRITTVSLIELPVSAWNGFRVERFRPLIERKTDISSLVALLNPQNHRQLEGV